MRGHTGKACSDAHIIAVGRINMDISKFDEIVACVGAENMHQVFVTFNGKSVEDVYELLRYMFYDDATKEAAQEIVLAVMEYGDDLDYLMDKIEECLPHESGINYNWEIETEDGMYFVASNSCDVMDSDNYYCCTFPFDVFLTVNGDNITLDGVKMSDFEPCPFAEPFDPDDEDSELRGCEIDKYAMEDYLYQAVEYSLIEEA